MFFRRITFPTLALCVSRVTVAVVLAKFHLFSWLFFLSIALVKFIGSAFFCIKVMCTLLFRSRSCVTLLLKFSFNSGWPGVLGTLCNVSRFCELKLFFNQRCLVIGATVLLNVGSFSRRKSTKFAPFLR